MSNLQDDILDSIEYNNMQENGMSRENEFSAKGPFVGYLYQIRYGLLTLLREKEKENPLFLLESLDDIVFQGRDYNCLIQTKHHSNLNTTITDKSPEFWKTIRIWCNNIASGKIKINNSFFTLVTTATISKNSFLYQFLHDNASRDNNSILNSMRTICKNDDTNNKKNYSEFKKLSPTDQKELIEKICIVSKAPTIDEVFNDIKNELIYVAPVGHLEDFTIQVDSWWFERCVSLLSKKGDGIYRDELNMKISDLRDQYSKDDLPDDFPNPFEIDDNELQNHAGSVYIKQLKLIDIKDRSLRNAISDYQRTYQQRAKWLRDNLTGQDEYDRFDNLLYDNWKNKFELMKDDSENLDEEELIKIGHDFYTNNYIKSQPNFRIRTNFQPEYFTRGCCQLLSDAKRIGWHPNFLEKLDDERMEG